MPPAMIEYMAETRRVRGRLRERAMPLDPSASGRPMSLYEWLEARGD